MAAHPENRKHLLFQIIVEKNYCYDLLGTHICNTLNGTTKNISVLWLIFTQSYQDTICTQQAVSELWFKNGIAV